MRTKGDSGPREFQLLDEGQTHEKLQHESGGWLPYIQVSSLSRIALPMPRLPAALAGFLCFVLWVAAPVAAQDASDAPTIEECEETFAEAEEAYFDERFSEANDLLSECLNQDDLPDALLVEMSRLSALAYINLGNLDQARRSVLRLLSVDPSYEPDPVRDPPSYVSLVETVQRQLQIGALDIADAPEIEEERGGRTWLAILGGAVLAGAATSAVLLLGGNGNGNGDDPLEGPGPLPEPPRLP